MQNQAIELHDSELDQITFETSTAALHFPHVYIHSSEGRPGVDAGSGWSQEAILRVEDARVVGQFPRELLEVYGDGACLLCSGQIKVNGSVSDNLIPIPLDVRGTVELQLECWGEVIRVQGTAATLELTGTARYVEEFHP